MVKTFRREGEHGMFSCRPNNCDEPPLGERLERTRVITVYQELDT
jgi:hypothetical protein